METIGFGGLTPAEATAQRLRIDYATAEVLRGLDAAGIASILLKGASVVRWLYEPGARRGYGDCDLLVSPDTFDAAGEVLARLGFAPELEVAKMPAWWREHGVEWLRAGDNAAIDLHRTLAGTNVAPEVVWTTLSARTRPIDIAGVQARSLDQAGIVLHLALHVAQHGGMGSNVTDLELAISRSDDELWDEVRALAADLDATAGLAAGLNLAPTGVELVAGLGLEDARNADVHLRGSGPPGALTLEQFARAGWLTRFSMAWRKVVPPPTFMRKWSPLAQHGRLGLLAAYLWRPIWIIGRAPGALRAWARARRNLISRH